MPVLVDNGAYSVAGKKCQRDKPFLQFGDPKTQTLTLGLINNMPDLAIERTERQFIKLLDAAAQGVSVRLKLYSLPGLPRSERANEYLSARYSSLDDLRNAHLDALIVTGTEPHASNLKDEPYWPTLAEIIDWAEQNTISTIWSCLAAHAVVFQVDGISRVPLRKKCFGVFNFANVSDHHLMRDMPAHWRTPHSRWNDLHESALISCGYSVLTKSDQAGVDIFVKQTRSLFIFLQGHPEYAEDTLLREYRRDIGRFLRGERENYPDMPSGYFDKEATGLLAAFREKAVADPRKQVLTAFPDTLKLANTWGPQAERIYRNWLSYVAERSAKRVAGRRARLASDQVGGRRVGTIHSAGVRLPRRYGDARTSNEK
jgi:homoserine O-succinyltransferase